MPKPIVTQVDLLRHGACEGGEIFRGSTDVPLSDEGWQQMRGKVAAVAEPPWSTIISSPLRRCRQFADELAAQARLPVVVNSELREMHFGDWEGLPHAEAQQLDPEAWRQFWQSPDQASPPNGEAMPDFCQRVTTAADALLATHAGESLLVVAHGAVNRVVICHWLGMPMGAMTRLSVPYAGLTRFKVYHQEGLAPWFQLDSHF